MAPARLRAGYSAETATGIGHENLRKPHVAETIGKARAKRAELTPERVIDELRKIADANMADYLEAASYCPRAYGVTSNSMG